MISPSLEPAVVAEVCDIVDAYPDTLRLILPRDKHRVAELVDDAEGVEHASALLSVQPGEALDRLESIVTAAGLHYSLLNLRSSIH